MAWGRLHYGPLEHEPPDGICPVYVIYDELRLSDEDDDDGPHEPAELVTRAREWEMRCARTDRWRLRWHSITCACAACLVSDFIAYYVNETVLRLEVRGLGRRGDGPESLPGPDLQDEPETGLARESPAPGPGVR